MCNNKFKLQIKMTVMVCDTENLCLVGELEILKKEHHTSPLGAEVHN